MKEQPWHAEALRLRRQTPPLTYAQLGAACGVHRNTVSLLLNPSLRAEHNRRNYARTKERMAADPTFRERHRAQCQVANKRLRIRKAAQAEAAETGRPVEELYAAWGVS